MNYFFPIKSPQFLMEVILKKSLKDFDAENQFYFVMS